MNNVLLTAVLAIQILSAITMIGLILIQHGKGADMGASFGSGSAGSVFGAAGSANFLSRTTSALAAVFFLTTLGLGYLGTSGPTKSSTSSGLIEKISSPAPSTSAPAVGASASQAAPAAATTPASSSNASGDKSIAPASPASAAIKAGSSEIPK